MADVRTSWPKGHVVHMSLDHKEEQSVSVAQCDCGWVKRVPWPGHHAQQDKAIERHWRKVETVVEAEENQRQMRKTMEAIRGRL